MGNKQLQQNTFAFIFLKVTSEESEVALQLK
jgi:hypothetical protein